MNSGFDTFMRPIVVRAQDDVAVSLSPQYERSKVGFPIRKSLDQSSFAAPQGLSQRTTSFIASQRQGIHRMPLRHLIALMIDVRRSAAPDKDVRKTISIPNPPKTPKGAPTDRRRCLPNTSDRLQAAGAASSLGTCSLFTMSNIRQPRSRQRIPFTRTPKTPLVEPDGIEPTTSCLQSTRSPN